MSITAATKRYAVIGDPVSHSLSPVMHNGWIADHGLDARLCGAAAEERRSRRRDPRAEAVSLGSTSRCRTRKRPPAPPIAAKAPVANVLRWEDGRHVLGVSTPTAWVSSTRWTKPRRIGARQCSACSCLARAARRRAIARRCRRLRRDDRTSPTAPRTRAEQAGRRDSERQRDALGRSERRFGARRSDRASDNARHGRPAGDRTGRCRCCRPNAIVADIVYRPLETPLLQAARERGLVAIDGLGMLIHQGARSFELWFGIKPDTAKARERLMAALRMIVIGLTGSIGMGKSTVAPCSRRRARRRSILTPPCTRSTRRAARRSRLWRLRFPGVTKDGAIDRAALSAARRRQCRSDRAA